MSIKKQVRLVNYIAILSIFLFSGAGSFMNAAVQTIMEAWPQLSPTTVRLVTSLPSLISIPVTIFIGGIAGRKLSFRFCAVFGTVLIAFSGAAPFFFHTNWALVLVFRALVGVGVGFIAMRNSLILKSVPEEKQTAVVGYGSALMNLGGMLAGPIVGALCAFGWRFSFLYDLLALVPAAIMIFALKEPDEEDLAVDNNADHAVYAGAKGHTDKRVWFYIIAQFVGTMALYPLLSGMSTYMSSEGIGNPVVAGLTVSAYNLAGILINIVLNPLLKKLGKNALWVMHSLFAVSMAIIVFLPHVPAIVLGALIAGMSFNASMSVYQLYNGQTAGSKATLTSTMLIAALSLGNFASVYFINFCHSIFSMASDIKSTYLGSMIVYIVLSAICLLIRVAPADDK